VELLGEGQKGKREEKGKKEKTHLVIKVRLHLGTSPGWDGGPFLCRSTTLFDFETEFGEEGLRNEEFSRARGSRAAKTYSLIMPY
jgi:hypothetical protein